MNEKHRQKLLQALEEKFGSEIVLDNVPWSQKQEFEFLYYNRILEQRLRKNELPPLKKGDFYISQKLINFDRECKKCNKICFKTSNNIYLTKYGCCEKCFIQHIEGREIKWTDKDSTTY